MFNFFTVFFYSQSSFLQQRHYSLYLGDLLNVISPNMPRFFHILDFNTRERFLILFKETSMKYEIIKRELEKYELSDFKLTKFDDPCLFFLLEPKDYVPKDYVILKGFSFEQLPDLRVADSSDESDDDSKNPTEVVINEFVYQHSYFLYYYTKSTSPQTNHNYCIDINCADVEDTYPIIIYEGFSGDPDEFDVDGLSADYTNRVYTALSLFSDNLLFNTNESKVVIDFFIRLTPIGFKKKTHEKSHHFYSVSVAKDDLKSKRFIQDLMVNVHEQLMKFINTVLFKEPKKSCITAIHFTLY